MSKLAIIICIFTATLAFSQNGERGYFAAYETLEMAMNNFQNFAGEVGYRFDQKNQMRLTIMEVKLTERHLSSGWEAAAVDGSDVEGYFQGYEVFYDRFIFKHLYVSASLGYYHDTYEHTKSDERLANKTFTMGTGIGFTTSNLFGVKHLYLNFSIPVRYYFNPIEETMMGETTIRPHVVVSNIWLFLGFKF